LFFVPCVFAIIHSHTAGTPQTSFCRNGLKIAFAA